MSNEEQKQFRDAILAEAEKGNIVFMANGEPMIASLDQFIQQPAEGILYDLNRSREVVLTYIDDPKWVNDYAVALVITKLKAEIVMTEREKSLENALDFTAAAIGDAIFAEDGLDGGAGERVLQLMAEAKIHGTSDKTPVSRAEALRMFNLASNESTAT